MRALTVKQPWAWAIIHAGKDVENRTRATSHRGPMAIHASKNCPLAYYETAAAEIERIAGKRPPPLEELPRGCVVGTVELVDCVRGDGSPWAQPAQVHWKMRAPRARRSKPVRGALYLFEVNDRMMEAA